MTNPVHKRMTEVHGLRCPLCAVEMVTPELTKAGELGWAECSQCGVRKEIILEHQIRQVFEWGFDFGARTVFWDVSALHDWLQAKGNPFPVTTLPVYAVQHLYEQNRLAHQLDEEPPSVSGNAPVLLIPHPSALAEQENTFPLLIDGWHRVRQAAIAKRELPAIMLPSKVERAFRLMDIVHVGCAGWEVDRKKFVPSDQTLLEVMDGLSEKKMLHKHNRIPS